MKIDYVRDGDVDLTLDGELRGLLSQCFVGPHNERFKTQRYYQELPQHRWIMRNEQNALIAHVAMHEKQLVTGEGDYPIAGVAEVCVHPDYRGKGFVSMLLDELHQFAADAGFCFAVLFGETEVYGSQGYRQFDQNAMRLRGEDVIVPVLFRKLTDQSWPEGKVTIMGPTF